MSGGMPNVDAAGWSGADTLECGLLIHSGWDIQMSRWNYAPVIVNYPVEETGDLVCFAPPGASLNGETDLGLAVWRRGTWDAEWAFTAGRSPIAVEEINIWEARAQLPHHLYRWGVRETAAHLERLRAFVQRRDHRHDLIDAADRLEEELKEIEPDALESHCLESSIEATRSDVLERQRRLRSDVLSLRSIGWDRGLRLIWQVALLLSLYLTYRLVRPDMGIKGNEIALTQLPLQSVPELLMWAYGSGHVVLSFGVLGWFFFRQHSVFGPVRNAVLLAAALTVIPYLLFAPGAGYGAEAPEVVPASALATMPAMHLAVALVLGISVALISRSTWARLLWLGYPALALGTLIVSSPSGLPLAIAGGFAAAIIAMLSVSAVAFWSWKPVAPPDLQRQLAKVPVLRL